MRYSIASGSIGVLAVWATATLASPVLANSGDAALIRHFYALIDQYHVAVAVTMLGPEIAPTRASRAAWAKQFSAIASAQVTSVRPSGFGDEAPCRSYKVTIDVKLRPQIGQSAIPNYGWGPNPNLRWLTVCPGPGTGRHIASIATGP